MSKVTYDEAFKRNAYGSKPSTHGNGIAHQDEVVQLGKQVARYRAELAILEKAVGIF